jgi:hypothetical protein
VRAHGDVNDAQTNGGGLGYDVVGGRGHVRIWIRHRRHLRVRRQVLLGHASKRAIARLMASRCADAVLCGIVAQEQATHARREGHVALLVDVVDQRWQRVERADAELGIARVRR